MNCKGGSVRILEPCAGNGNIINSLLKHECSNIKAVEIRSEEADTLNDLLGYGNFTIADFLSLNKKYIGDCDVILTNPPFSLAMEFIIKSLDVVSDTGKVIMLLKLSFLSSRKRFEFMKNTPPTDLYVLHQRPSFTGGGTDSQEYAWFIWDKSKRTQTIKVI